mmetsp:Transcript_7949/g.15480  ORF Transcript_7949/g.15480 Transcript_7949/m.15480 type:complete len:291 (-) Transcript_7949:1650-2522(-)
MSEAEQLAKQLAEQKELNAKLKADLEQVKGQLDTISHDLVKVEAKHSRIHEEQKPSRMAMHRFVRNTAKQLKMLRLDEKMLLQKLVRMEDPATISDLIVEVSSKEQTVKQLERKNKKLKSSFRGTTKTLTQESSSEDIKKATEELSRIATLVGRAQESVARAAKKSSKNQGKIARLDEEASKLTEELDSLPPEDRILPLLKAQVREQKRYLIGISKDIAVVRKTYKPRVDFLESELAEQQMIESYLLSMKAKAKHVASHRDLTRSLSPHYESLLKLKESYHTPKPSRRFM